jgi:GntR family transcriptional repressor for pyruvate dehydrogenase complex
LYEAIIGRQAERARELSSQHILYVQEVLDEAGQEAQRIARAQRRSSQ